MKQMQYEVHAILSRTYGVLVVEADDPQEAWEKASQSDKWNTAVENDLDLLQVIKAQPDHEGEKVFTRYLVVSGSGDVRRMQAYLYSNDKVLSHVESDDRFVAVVQINGTDEINAVYRQDYVAQRLSSGMMQTQRFDNLDAANAESIVTRAVLGV